MSGMKAEEIAKLQELFSKVQVRPVNYKDNRALYLEVKRVNDQYIIRLPYSISGNADSFNSVKELLKSLGFKYSGAPDYVWVGDRTKYALLASKVFEYLSVEARIMAYEAGATNRYIERAKEILNSIVSSTEAETQTIIESNSKVAERIQSDIEALKIAMPTLYDYQVEGVKMILNAYYHQRKGFILADEQGLGKTVQAIAFLSAIYKPGMTVLIVCPDIMIYTWYDKFFEFDTRGNLKMHLSIKKPTKGAINIVNYHALSTKTLLPAVISLSPDIIILDEAHNLKNPNSARSKNIRPIADRARFILALTGTIVKNRPMEAYYIMKLLNMLPQNVNNLISFIREFEGDMAAYYYRLKVFTRYYRTIESARAVRLIEYLKSTSLYVRRTKKDVISQLPSKTRIFVTINISAQNNVQLVEALSQESEILKMLEAEIKIPRDVAMRISTYRRIIGMEKVKYVISYIVSKLSDKNKFIVYAHHDEVIQTLYVLLKEHFPEHEIYVLNGSVNKKNRSQSVVAFQSDGVEKAIVIASLAVASEGITLTASDEIVFAELDYVPATLMQAEDRIHRISQKSSVCTYHYIIAAQTLDQYIYNVLRHKTRYLKHINTN